MLNAAKEAYRCYIRTKQIACCKRVRRARLSLNMKIMQFFRKHIILHPVAPVIPAPPDQNSFSGKYEAADGRPLMKKMEKKMADYFDVEKRRWCRCSPVNWQDECLGYLKWIIVAVKCYAVLFCPNPLNVVLIAAKENLNLITLVRNFFCY